MKKDEHQIVISKHTYDKLKEAKKKTGVYIKNLIDALVEREEKWLDNPDEIIKHLTRR